MNIDLQKIYDIYDEDILESLNENIEEVQKNLNYFISLGFEDYEYIFERCTPLFIYNHSEFKDKINNLIIKLGINYIDTIENDLSLVEDLL